MQSLEYVTWCETLRQPPLKHRKLWEWCYILQVLDKADMFRAGRRGLGFGVGHEPIAAYAAAQGCDIVATDLSSREARAGDWRDTGQHADRLGDLNDEGLCPTDVFERGVSFRPVDMRAIPTDPRQFDFSWSSCAMEHLGSLEGGLEFFENQVACLRPGGVGVHTTEFNVTPAGPTLETGPTVLYQRQHLEHQMSITFALGASAEDLHVRRHALHRCAHPH